jgi:hypothetical protein
VLEIRQLKVIMSVYRSPQFHVLMALGSLKSYPQEVRLFLTLPYWADIKHMARFCDIRSTISVVQTFNSEHDRYKNTKVNLQAVRRARLLSRK